jgi:hypothetical protein
MHYFTVYIDGRACTLSEHALAEFGLKAGQRIGRDEFDDERLELLACFIEAEAMALDAIDEAMHGVPNAKRG